jgi:HAD superfamily hydrolase (TIGR01490 family)
MMPAVAAFDFDGTITTRDTVLPFLRAVVGSAVLARWSPFALPVVCVRGMGLLGSTATKEWLFRLYLRGRAMDEVRAAAQRFARDEVPGLLRTEAVARLRWHQARGDRCLVVTASPDLYVIPWASAVGLEAISSKLEVDASGRLTGRHEGPACDGPEKVRRLRDLLGSVPPDLYAYGDSHGDRELLALARHAFWRAIPRPGA